MTTGIPFLGFRVYPDHRRLKRRNGVAFARRACAMAARDYAHGELTLAEVTRRVQGWVAHAAHGETWGLRRALLRTVIPGADEANRPSSPAPTTWCSG